MVRRYAHYLNDLRPLASPHLNVCVSPLTLCTFELQQLLQHTCTNEHDIDIVSAHNQDGTLGRERLLDIAPLITQ